MKTKLFHLSDIFHYLDSGHWNKEETKTGSLFLEMSKNPWKASCLKVVTFCWTESFFSGNACKTEQGSRTCWMREEWNDERYSVCKRWGGWKQKETFLLSRDNSILPVSHLISFLTRKDFKDLLLTSGSLLWLHCAGLCYWAMSKMRVWKYLFWHQPDKLLCV